MMIEVIGGESNELKEKIKSLKDGKYWIEIKNKKPSRSSQQNRYYWGVVLQAMSETTGYSVDEMHQLMARKYLAYEKYDLMFSRSTTQLDTKEFEEYMEKLRHFASVELACWIPEPNEENYDKYLS